MTGSRMWDLLIGIVAALLVAWAALTATLAVVRPRGGLLREALRLLPDVLRLVRLAGDCRRSCPRSTPPPTAYRFPPADVSRPTPRSCWYGSPSRHWTR
ncbi:hypothetical protein EDD27_7939 [Nonomuraea polychroma]|uniref:Uncharacterized protein n=1 Tax=Nonomuraea polychroma TaxID=46176 RepID=A0A438MH30_9ACTN|nr:hypothetical protein EDD27_7939 [Nonomuraea polychroma]